MWPGCRRASKGEELCELEKGKEELTEFSWLLFSFPLPISHLWEEGTLLFVCFITFLSPPFPVHLPGGAAPYKSRSVDRIEAAFTFAVKHSAR